MQCTIRQRRHLECSVDRADRSSPCSPRFARAICFLPVVSPTGRGTLGIGPYFYSSLGEDARHTGSGEGGGAEPIQ